MVSLKNHAFIFLKGLLMGIADAIPGVSGGTIALITQIYTRLVNAINNINSLFVKELCQFKLKSAFQNIRKIDFNLFIPLIFGILVAVVTLSHLMDFLLTERTSVTYAFFFGLILASAFIVYPQSNNKSRKNVFLFLWLIIGFIGGLIVAGLGAMSANHSDLVILFSGAIAICAMILPGISGAFILVLLNQYEYLIGAVKNILLSKLLIFAAGAVIGLLSFSKLLSFLLKKYKNLTLSCLTGLMLGSLRLPYYKIISVEFRLSEVLIAAMIGFLLVFILEKKYSRHTRL